MVAVRSGSYVTSDRIEFANQALESLHRWPAPLIHWRSGSSPFLLSALD
jgi:hypothetical protein